MREVILTMDDLLDESMEKEIHELTISDFYIDMRTRNRASIIVFVEGFKSKVFKYKNR